MRLETLSKYDDRTAKAVVAAAASVYDSGPYRSESATRFEKEAKELIEEIRRNVLPQKSEADTVEAIRKVLSEQVVAAIMGNRDLQEVSGRLSREGRLPLSAYKVRFRKNFERDTKENEKYILRAIREATEVQHLVPQILPKNYSRGVTLIMVPQESRHGGSHWLLIDTMRDKAGLYVDRAFRVFPSVVDLTGANSPLEVLRAFVNHYGFEFGLDNLPKAKMFEQIVFAKSEDEINVSFSSNAPADGDVTVSGSSFEMKSQEIADKMQLPARGSVVIFAYGIDLQRYHRERRRIMDGLTVRSERVVRG